ncbi:SDR family oxidoreductase [Arenibacterium halophilum]|uniref:SDR family oxidoreductase n=1 Tax=Arenibacterium halophilum TaxID=2583821 RepID=A0ABY2X6R8_9RHOB|nr:SDR family oxidoreductase [Arenibacterium halophilum]TMV11474.1 SDR family oxidoreductase [Arenibacterium halophilum]
MTRVLITGAAGMIGRSVLARLNAPDVIATDLARGTLPPDTAFERLDVTTDDPARVIAAHRPDVVVHLASIVTPPPGMTRKAAHAVDVTGTRNVLQACIDHCVRRIVVTSSGAAYGYHADNPMPLRESDPCRGNPEFAYSDHKRQVEEILARARIDHPNLEQVVLRVGTVLGAGVENQITALFRRKRLLAVSGSDSPFVFIWTGDLARILHHAATAAPTGIFNVAGDGMMTVDDLARALKKPVLRIPASLLRAALAIAHPLGLTPYGPEQVRFLQYRPVLSNDRLKRDFGIIPECTSAQAFDIWKQAAAL